MNNLATKLKLRVHSFVVSSKSFDGMTGRVQSLFPKKLLLYVKSNGFELVVFMILVVFPLSRVSGALWDGSIISFAVKEENFKILFSWFYSSGWELQYWLIRATALIAEFLEINFEKFNLYMMMCCLFVISHQVRYIALKVFLLKPIPSRFAGILTMIFPVWNILTSSVINIHILCLSLGLVSFNFIWSNSIIKKIAAFPLLIVAFQLHSLLFFLPSLVFVSLALRKRFELQQILKKKEILCWGFLALPYFFWKIVFNPNTGFYEGYNGLLSPLKLHSWRLYFEGIANFSSFLVLPLIAALPIIFQLLTRKFIYSELLKSILNKVMASLALLLAAVIPYILIGKWTSLFDIEEWNQRQAILVAIPIALMIASLIDYWSQVLTETKKILTTFLIAVIPIMQLSLFYEGTSLKITRSVFDLALVDYLRHNVSEPKAGIVQLNFDRKFSPKIRNYESNFVFYQAYGSVNWWTTVTSSRVQNSNIPQNVNRQNSLELLYRWQTTPCITRMQFHITGFPERENIFLPFDSKSGGHITLKSMAEDC